MTKAATLQVTKVAFLHYMLRKVEDYNRDNPERDIQVMVFSNSLEAHWESDKWDKHYGKLLHVQRVEETFFIPDPIQVELEVLRKEITNIQATAEKEIKERRDRINDLLMIGYDSGQATVVDVTDAMAKAHDNDIGCDDAFPV